MVQNAISDLVELLDNTLIWILPGMVGISGTGRYVVSNIYLFIRFTFSVLELSDRAWYGEP